MADKTSLRVTVDIFSGRENPTLELRGRDAKVATSLLKPTKRKKREKIPPISHLGYRGLIVEQTTSRGKVSKTMRILNGSLITPTRGIRLVGNDFEDFICGSTGPIRRIKFKKNFQKFVWRELIKYREWVIEWPYWKHIPKCKPCKCAPIYEPNWWNDGYGGQKQPNNNCYNYATNYRTDTFAQPGKASGSMYTSLTCGAVRPAAIRDDLIDKPSANNKCPTEGHLVALVVGPGWDYHWYRKDENGCWSHKPGGTPVTNLDNSGNKIHDPRTADRGSYTDFCTFMIVKHGHIKIR